MVSFEKVTEESSDIMLAESFLAGNDLAFSWLFERYIKQVSSFTWRLCVDPTIADRVAIESFARLRARGWKIRGSFKFHLFSACHHLSLTSSRASRVEVDTPAFGGGTLGADSFGGSSVEQARIERGLAKLPFLARSILLLYYAHGLAPLEVAKIVDIKSHQVYRQIAGARLLLRNSLMGEI